MESNHTPGPWVYEPEVLFQGSHVAGRNPTITRPTFPDKGDDASEFADIIAKVARQKEHLRRDDEAEANARLIAAAPDLYEALKAAQNHLGGEQVKLAPSDPDYSILETIRAALAKVQP